MDHAYLFNQGEDYMVYNFLGSHPYTDGDTSGFVFRVWAPKASGVSVIGDFNDWEPNASPMYRLGNSGIWEVKIEGACQWDRYKYRVIGADNRIYDKGDPYARHFETRPNNASILYDPDDYKWGDSKFMKSRPNAVRDPQPIKVHGEDIRTVISLHIKSLP